jgi:hypothetical protein
MTEYGNPSRVSVDLSGGNIIGIAGSEQQKAVLFSRGDPNAGTVEANDPTKVSGPGELSSTFGEGEPINEQFRKAAGNGKPYSMMWGVVPEETTVSNEQLTGGSDGSSHTDGSKISNAPIIEDKSLITVEDDTSNTVTVSFRYETNMDDTNSDFTSLSPGNDEMFINPRTGEWIAGSSDTYNISYDYADWQSAFDSATEIIKEQEVGEWLIDSGSDAIVGQASATVKPLRENQWKMVRVMGTARPNVSGVDDDPHYDPTSYTDSQENGYTFLFAPERVAGEDTSVIGAVGGAASSSAITNPIIGATLTGVQNVNQTLTVPEQESMEDAGVIPVSNSGSPTIEGNTATEVSGGWKKTYFSRRVGDQLLLGARAIAKATRGRLNNDNTETIVEQEISDEIVEMIDDGILRPNTEENQRWYVNADQAEDNARELQVSLGFTPTGVVDKVTINATINY